MYKKFLSKIVLLSFIGILFSCTEKNNKIKTNTEEEIIQVKQTVENIVEEQNANIPEVKTKEELIVEKDFLENNYIFIGENKVPLEKVFITEKGSVIFSLLKYSLQKIENPELYTGTYIFYPESQEFTLLTSTTDFGATEFDDKIEIDDKYLFRFYHGNGLDYVDIYNYETNEYAYSGYNGNLDLENHIIYISLKKVLNPEDEEKVKSDFENIDYGDLPESYKNSLTKVYKYEINYISGESKILKGDEIMEY